MDWFSLLETYGLAGALLVFFVWRDFMREKKQTEERSLMVTRIQIIEDFQRDEMKTMIEATTAALTTSNEVLMKCTATLDACSDVLKETKNVLQDR